MSDITLTFYELQKSPQIPDFWPANIPSIDHVSEQISSSELDFEDDIAEPIEEWAEDLFISQYIVQLDLQAFSQAGQKEVLISGLRFGHLVSAGEMDFISQIDNSEINDMINQLLGLSLSGWDMDEELAKEESEVADFIGFLAATKMRGHSILGVAVNS